MAIIKSIAKNGNKEIKSFTLSSEVIEKLQLESFNNDVSASEVTEYALRKIFKMPMDDCRLKLASMYP